MRNPRMRSWLVTVSLGAAAASAYAQHPTDVVASDAQANTAMGTSALFDVITIDGAIWNTAAGAHALEHDTSGFDNTAAGAYALQANTGGFSNTAVGAQALQYNSTGSGNTAAGEAALFSNTTGSDNTAVGLSALVESGAGSDNSAFGANALASLQTGSQNTAIGSGALVRAMGSGNTAVGYAALNSFMSEQSGANTAVGTQALESNAGSSNTALGWQAGVRVTAGGNNTALGYQALDHDTIGSFNIGIGNPGGQALTVGSHNIDIGNLGQPADERSIRIGTQGVQTATFIAGVYGTVLTGSAVYVTPTGRLGVLPSAERYKTDIATIDTTGDKLDRLRPVSYHLKFDPEGAVQYGLVAEEVDAVYPELVIRDEKGEVQGIHYEQLAPLLIHEIQQQRGRLGREEQRAIDQDRAIDALREELAEVRRVNQEMQAALLEMKSRESRFVSR